MTAIFADTFYWIALIDLDDGAHERALELTTSKLAHIPVITTDEVLVEYRLSLRRPMTTCAAKPLRTRGVFSKAPMSVSFRRAGIRFFPAWLFTKRGPTKAIASRIAFRCRSCAGRTHRRPYQRPAF
jgi:predicted nucleic acid-binding protein